MHFEANQSNLKNIVPPLGARQKQALCREEQNIILQEVKRSRSLFPNRPARRGLYPNRPARRRLYRNRPARTISELNSRSNSRHIPIKTIQQGVTWCKFIYHA